VGFDGSSDSLTFTNDAGMSLDGDYTFELWFNASTIVQDTQHPNMVIIGTTQLFVNSTSKFVSLYHSGADIVKSANNAIGENEWYHVAAVRSGSGTNNTSLYLNGTRVAQATNTATLGASSGTGRIGSYDGTGGDFDGHISNIRLVKGTALYSGASITVPTAPLTAVTNTQLLTCQSNRFVDNSASAHTITANGNAAVSAFGPFLTSEVYDPAVNGASWYCAAQGDYLSMSTGGTALQNPSTFTLEGWIYMKQAPASGLATAIFAQGNAGQTTLYNSYSVGVRSDLAPRVVTAGFQQETIRSSTAINLNEWAHLALTWDGTTWSLYQNGVREGASTLQPISTTNYSQAYFGRDYFDDSRFAPNCFYSDIRMVTSLLYTGSTYTVPTAPLTAVANTQLLVHCKEAQAIDSAAQNNLTLVGTAKTSTAQSAFGTASLLLDGDSDLAKIPSASGDLGSGDWTIEFSFRLSADVGGTAQTCISKWESSGDQRGWVVRLVNSTGNKMQFRVTPDGTSASIVTTTFSTAFSHSTWYNVALVNSSGTVTLYVDGTADSTTYTLASGEPRPNVGIDVAIGAAVPSSPNTFFNGYIDEVRISKVARHTSSYTPKAFADKGQST
jgi:hypothetical protein